MTGKATAVLRYLVERAEQIVTKEELFIAVWPDTVVSDAALSTCIQEIRQALRDDARRPRYIETVHRRGFRFIGKVISDQLSVVSQTEGVRSQEEVASSQNSVVSREEENHRAKDGNAEQAEGFMLEVEGPLSFPPPIHFWSSRMLILFGLLLLAGGSSVVYLLSLSLPSTQPLTPNTQSLPLPDKPSIIVLLFQNLSGDPAQDYFSDGLTDVLTGHLSRISSLFVISRNSAFTYKGKAVKVQDVSKEMGVRYVLEGSVQKTHGQVRITAQLIEATTGFHLWSEQYDRPLQDFFALQDEIVQKIVTTLRLQLPMQEQGFQMHKHTDNLEAYNYYLRGCEYYSRYTKEANAQARQMMESAIAVDPQYAEAYAGLGEIYLAEWGMRWSANPQTLERALALGQQALALDDSIPGAHALLSRVYGWQQQSDHAIAEGERAIALNPNDADSYRNSKSDVKRIV